MRLPVASSLALASAFLAQAKPLQQRDTAVTLTTDQYDNMKYYAQYSTSAYCNSQGAVGALVTCEEGCADVMANGATVLGTFPNTTLFDLEGFVAVDSTRQEIVVAFRGSSTIRNWIADFNFVLVSYDYCDGCYVHAGFKESWEEVKTYALSYIESAFAAYPDYTLVVTGHSLGAAVGTLVVAELRESGYAVDLYTVGSPRVGNLAFAKFVTEQTGAEYRATHYDDPVPRLPPIVLGYFHTSPEYWLEAGPATNTDYALSDIAVCTGYANTDCNAGTTGLDADAHSYYFQYLGCSEDDSDGISFRKKDEILAAGDRPLWLRGDSSSDISDEELAAKLTNYTYQDIAYAQELVANGTITAT